MSNTYKGRWASTQSFTPSLPLPNSHQQNTHTAESVKDKRGFVCMYRPYGNGAGVRQPPWPVSVDQQSTRSVVDDWPCLVLVKDEVSGVWLSLDQDRMKSVVCDCRWIKIGWSQWCATVVGWWQCIKRRWRQWWVHLALDRYLCQHPTTQFFTGQMRFLPPNQQHQSIEEMSDGRKLRRTG